MTTVISVRFRSGCKTYYFDPKDLTVEAGQDVIVETAQGPEFAQCCEGNHAVPDEQVVPPLRAVLLAAAPWLVTGFLHLDGYMDVCDALLSRRDLTTRQKILKDSHCGAFAVICMVLLAAGQCALFAGAPWLRLLPLGAIPVASRACASVAVQRLRPMGTSQYAAMQRGTGLQLVFPLVCLLAACTVPVVLCGAAGLAPLAAAAGYCLAVWRGFRQLDGMSGDISGFGLTLGELAGLAFLFLTRYYL